METLELIVKEQIATLRFNRPKYLNSYNWQMSEELPDLLATLASQPAIKVVIVEGAGTGFMAGGDLNFLKNAQDRKNDEYTLTAIQHLNSSVSKILSMEKIFVANVHGAVAGAGLSLMLACDLVVIEDATKVNLAYTAIGLSPDGGLSVLLPAIIGNKKALQLLALEERPSVEGLAQLNLVNYVVTAKARHECVQEVVQSLLAAPFTSLISCKKLLNAPILQNLDEHLAREAQYFMECSKTEDFAKRVAALTS